MLFRSELELDATEIQLAAHAEGNAAPIADEIALEVKAMACRGGLRGHGQTGFW